MTTVRLDQVVHNFGVVSALDRVDLRIEHGSLTALLGPSGCGKTTALKIIAGLLRPTSGRVMFDGHDVTSVAAERRDAVLVFQDHRLFPYLPAGDNVAFGLRMRGVGRTERRRRAEAAMERVGLHGLIGRRPSELSGGQQQRVALARALVVEPSVLLLDEPLTNLDAHLRSAMRDLIRDVHREHDLTTVMVTHDQEEAVTLADDIALVIDGCIHQQGAPRTFIERPATARTAQFFGAMNMIPGVRHGMWVDTPVGRLRVPDGAVSDRHQTPGWNESHDVWVTIRPERIMLGEPIDDRHHRVETRVRSSSFLGAKTRAIAMCASGVELAIDTTGDELADVGPGATLVLGLPSRHLWTVPRDPGDPALPTLPDQNPMSWAGPPTDTAGEAAGALRADGPRHESSGDPQTAT